MRRVGGRDDRRPSPVELKRAPSRRRRTGGTRSRADFRTVRIRRRRGRTRDRRSPQAGCVIAGARLPGPRRPSRGVLGSGRRALAGPPSARGDMPGGDGGPSASLTGDTVRRTVTAAGGRGHRHPTLPGVSPACRCAPAPPARTTARSRAGGGAGPGRARGAGRRRCGNAAQQQSGKITCSRQNGRACPTDGANAPCGRPPGNGQARPAPRTPASRPRNAPAGGPSGAGTRAIGEFSSTARESRFLLFRRARRVCHRACWTFLRSRRTTPAHERAGAVTASQRPAAVSRETAKEHVG